MKAKKFIVLLLVLCCFAIVGCDNSTTQFVQTNYGVYDFYYKNLVSCQNSIKQDVSSVEIDASDKNKIDLVLNSLNSNLYEEMAIVASVECYGVVSNPKEIIISSGDVFITVELQQNKNYVCKISDNQNEYNYSFNIVKDGVSNQYTVKYSKNISDVNYNCTANVYFDNKISHLSIDVESYSNSGVKISTYKDFYALNNNNSAFKCNLVLGESNSRSIYAIDTYREIFAYKTKISNCDEINNQIDVNNLTKNGLVTSNDNDESGYIIDFNFENDKPDLEKFGDFVSW